MPAFKFNSAPTGNLSTSQYYMTVVETTPTASMTTRADLVEPVGFTPVLLTGKNLNSERLTFDSFSFPSFTYPNSIAGMVLVERDGSNAPSATDLLVSFTPFTNSIDQEITPAAGTFSIPIAFGANGALDLVATYRYSSGPYINTGSIPPGLIYLLGSQNETVPFSNPAPSKMTMLDGANNSITAATDRFLGVSSGSNTIGIDFGTFTVKVGDFGINSSGNNTTAFNLFGSNNLVGGLLQSTLNSATNWTFIGNGNFSPASWGFATITDQTFYRYLKITITNNANTFNEIELYNSTIESLTANMA